MICSLNGFSTGGRSAAAALLALSCSAVALAQDVTRPTDTIVASSDNFPGGEAPGGAIDNRAGSKYLNFDRINTGFTVTAGGTGVVRALAIITANDAPERDPTSFILEGSTDGVNFTPIAQGTLTPPIARFGFTQAAFPNSTQYPIYRVTFPSIRDGSANSMQVAEVQLLTARDILTPGDAFTVAYPPGAFAGAGEGPASLFDDRCGTKLGVFGGNAGPTIITVTPGLGATTVTGVDIFGASDDLAFGGRTPSYITISGSNNGQDFTQIFTSALEQTTEDMQDQQFTFTNTTAYRQYRLELGPATLDQFMQLGEIQLLGVTGNDAPANDVCATAQQVAAGSNSGANFNATGTDTTPCGLADSADVWFSYTSAVTGLVEANTFGPGSLDTTLAVYDGCDGPLVACDDNTRAAQSRVRWLAVTGREYKLRVAGPEGAFGAFTLNINEAPESNTDTFVPLDYNFNGMVHAGEGVDPDSPNGFRSLADRALRLTGAVGSIEVGLESPVSGLPYTVVTQAGELDMVQLGDRNVVDNRNFTFDLDVGGFDQGRLENFIGIQPTWLANTNQATPQTTSTAPLGLAMGPATRIGLIYQSSNGGTEFSVTLGFSGGQTAVVSVEAPDWFGDQDPGAPLPGVAQQHQLGVFFGSQNVDRAVPGVDLNVAEAVISTASLNAGGFGDFTGLRIESIAFSDALSVNADTGILAVTIRDGVSACRADFNGDSNLDPDDLSDFITGYFSIPPDARTDWNGDGTIDPDDLSDYITAYFTGC